MLGLASQGSSTEWPATEETGDATRAGGTAIFIYSLFSFNFENLLIRGKIIVSVWFQRGTTNLPIWHIWLTYESHFPPKFHQQLPKPLKVESPTHFASIRNKKWGLQNQLTLAKKNTLFSKNVKNGPFSVISARTRSVVILGHFFDGGPTNSLTMVQN